MPTISPRTVYETLHALAALGQFQRTDLVSKLSTSRLYSQRGSVSSGACRIGVELADGRHTAAVQFGSKVTSEE